MGNIKIGCLNIIELLMSKYKHYNESYHKREFERVNFFKHGFCFMSYTVFLIQI
jgi:hypothetical protein